MQELTHKEEIKTDSIKLDIQPDEFLSWHQKGRVIRGNQVYTKSGSIYNITPNGTWRKIEPENSPAAIYKFWKLAEQNKEESRIIIP